MYHFHTIKGAAQATFTMLPRLHSQCCPGYIHNVAQATFTMLPRLHSQCCPGYVHNVAQLAAFPVGYNWAAIIDVKAKIDLGESISTNVISMHNLGLVMKTTQTKSVLSSTTLQVGKHWAKVKTSAIAY